MLGDDLIGARKKRFPKIPLPASPKPRAEGRIQSLGDFPLGCPELRYFLFEEFDFFDLALFARFDLDFAEVFFDAFFLAALFLEDFFFDDFNLSLTFSFLRLGLFVSSGASAPRSLGFLRFRF